MSATDVELEFIESSNMFMNFRKNDFSHYWKVLYIDHNVLQVSETNKVDFLKQHNSRKFDDNEDLFMIGIYQTTVVLLGYVHESGNFLHFWKYERNNLKSCKKMNLRQIFQNSKRGSSKHLMYHPEDFKIIPELGKIMVTFCGTIIYYRYRDM